MTFCENLSASSCNEVITLVRVSSEGIHINFNSIIFISFTIMIGAAIVASILLRNAGNDAERKNKKKVMK